MSPTITAVTTAALADSFNPCAIGVLLLFLTVLFSFYKQRSLAFLFGAFYILGVYLTYLLIGLGILKAVHLFGIHGFFGWLSAVMLLIMGLIHLGHPWLNRLKFVRWMNSCHLPPNWKRYTQSGTVISALILGLLVGICEFPCSGSIYLATIGLLSNTASFWSGVGYLLVYNLIFVLPLVIIFILATRPSVLDKFSLWQQNHLKQAKALLGWFMIISSIILLSWLTF